jgi:hypothetical protein
MPARWDLTQNLNGARVEWPKGELTDNTGLTFPEAGLTPRWVEAWVVQEGTGASQRSVQTANWEKGHWTAKEDSRVNGSFLPGVALGIALLAYHDGTQDRHRWWLKNINLS